jgi:hypothetical protein
MVLVLFQLLGMNTKSSSRFGLTLGTTSSFTGD